MAADWDTSGIHERRVDERMAPEPRRGWLSGRRRTASVLTGLVSVAIIAAFIWSGRDRAELDAGGEPPLIQADEAPIRVPPDKPGGMEIPHRDKLVLQRVPGAEEDPRRERLLPPPEEPLPPREEPAASYEPPPESLPPPPAHESLAGEQPSPPASHKPAGKAEAPPAQARADGPRPLVPQAQQPAPPRSSGASGSHVWPSENARSSEAETKTGYVLPPARTQAPAGAAGTYMVQLAAVSTAEQAQAAWSRLRGNNGDLLAGLSPSYARADLGTKGVVYRLRAGPVQGETRARTLCAQLAGRKVDCMVVRAGG